MWDSADNYDTLLLFGSSVTANIGFSVDSDLQEKSLLRIGSIWCQNHVESNLYVFVPFNCFFVSRSESIFCPFKNTASDITWRYCHLISDLYGVCIIRITCLDPILEYRFNSE